MTSRIKIICVALSLLLNVVAIPFLLWKLAGYSMMYHRNVDYAAELAYAVGYHKALDSDLALELESYPTRLTLTKVDSNAVEAIIWPASGQLLRLEFSNPGICYATIVNDGVPRNGDR